jgi:phenylacetate-CoA ligase
MGIPVSALSLKYGLFRAEPWSEAVRQEIEDKLGIGATDNYGLFEIEGTEPHYQILVERKGAHVHDSRPESPRIMGRRGVKRP